MKEFMESFGNWIKANGILGESANHSKDQNDIFGETFEKKLVRVLGGKIKLSKKEEELIPDEEALEAAKAIRSKFKRIKNVEHVGPQVKNANGDIMVNGKAVEVKYVGSGHGTYWNTSIEMFPKMFGLKSYTKDFLKPLRDYLSQFFGDSVYNNTSPCTMEQSHEIRHNMPDVFEEVRNIEIPLRRKYVKYLINFFKNNPDEACNLYNIIVSKAASNKATPDYYLIYNYNKNEAEIFEANDLISMDTEFKGKEDVVTFIVGNFRVVLGWQNGTGLCNPTVRAFII